MKSFRGVAIVGLFLVAEGGAGGYTYAEVGSVLGSHGLSLNTATGEITGTDPTAETVAFEWSATDSSSNSQSLKSTIIVNHQLSWTAASPPTQCESGIPFSYQFGVSGATGTLTWTLAWPISSISGVSVSTGGLFGGTTSGSTGLAQPYTITVSDSGTGDSIEYDGVLQNFGAVTLNTITGVSGATGTDIVTPVVDVGLTTGVAPYLFTIDQTTLPAGVTASITASGRNGIATINASSDITGGSFTVYVRDAAGGTASASVTLDTFQPNQQMGTGDGSTTVTNPNALTFDPLGFTVTPDGTGGLNVANNGGAGAPFITGWTPDGTGGDSITQALTLENYVSGDVVNWEILSSSNLPVVSISGAAATGTVSLTYPSSGGTSKYVASATIESGTNAGATCYSRQRFSSTSTVWWASYFANGEDGFVFDFNDLTHMYTDTGATTPATAAGDVIKAIMDQIHGIVVTNSTGLALAQDGGTGLYYLPGFTVSGIFSGSGVPSAMLGSNDKTLIIGWHPSQANEWPGSIGNYTPNGDDYWLANQSTASQGASGGGYSVTGATLLGGTTGKVFFALQRTVTGQVQVAELETGATSVLSWSNVSTPNITSDAVVIGGYSATFSGGTYGLTPGDMFFFVGVNRLVTTTEATATAALTIVA